MGYSLLLTLINVGGGTIILPCRKNRDFSGTEHPSDLRPVCKFEFVRCGPGETNQSDLSVSVSPWRIRTLKYLEMKIEEWPSRAKWGQAGSNRTKWCQMVPNRVKRGQMGSNGAKNGQKVPYRAKPGQKGQRGQTRPNGVIWGWFFACTHIFMRLKNYV